MTKQVIQNKSQAFGYNYTSLADIANAGFTIPKMRVKNIDGADYIEYLDENNDWQTGARVVIPEMKGKNSAQMYGAGLTYARRYTCFNALGLVCSDDKDVETTPLPDIHEAKTEAKSGRNISKSIQSAESVEELTNLWKTMTNTERIAFKKQFTARKEAIEFNQNMLK